MAAALRYNESAFQAQLTSAIQELKKTIHNTKRPVAPATKSHTYDDKFQIANLVANLSVEAQLAALNGLGLDLATLKHAVAWHAQGKPVTLRHCATKSTTFLRETTRKVDSKTSHVTESTLFGRSESKSVTNVTEFFWRVELEWTLELLVVGTDSSKLLTRRVGGCEVMTTTRESPLPARVQRDPDDLSLVWLLSNLHGADAELCFCIDRDDAACKTPRRNRQTDEAVAACVQTASWASSVAAFYTHDVFRICRPTSASGADGGEGHGLDLRSLETADGSLFLPALPILLNREQEAEALAAVATTEATSPPQTADETQPPSGGGGALERPAPLAVVPAPKEGSPLLGPGDASHLLACQRRSLSERFAALAAAFPPADGEKLISVAEAKMVTVLRHWIALCEQLVGAFDHLEELLRKQLVAAVGRSITQANFAQYMEYHEARLFAPQFAPRALSHTVRREGHDAEGVVAIESAAKGDGRFEPIRTLTRRLDEPVPPMSFKLDAATRISFTGERHLHAYVAHTFGGGRPAALELAARARQFSAFVLMLGRLGPNQTFEPTHALLVQNKDELRIPLDLEPLPSAAAFRDAIASLSPEQRRFAEAYRAMQLEGSIFAMLVIQVKPACERLLNLPDDSLTKEIQLTQDVLELLRKYQIPSDMITYDGADSASTAEKLERVRSHVKVLKDLIEETKRKELAAAKRQHAYDHPGSRQHAYDHPGSDSCEEDDEQGMMAVGSAFSAAPGARGGELVNRKMMRKMAAPSCAAATPGPPPCPAPAAPMMSRGGKGGGGGPIGRGGQQQQRQQRPETATSALPQTREAAVEQKPLEADGDFADVGEGGGAFDMTRIPAMLDAKMLALDGDAALRSTTVTVGKRWQKREQRSLLAAAVGSTMGVDEQKRHKEVAFELLDVLSRSGALPIDSCSLHVVVASTHCFDTTLMDTVITDNVNPIEKLERSSLLVGTTIFGEPAEALVRLEQQQRVFKYSAPMLLSNAES